MWRIRLWKGKAAGVQRNGFDVRVSNLIETQGRDVEKENGFDLADYLINEQNQKNLQSIAYISLLKSPFFEGLTSASLF
jgi:hypothetical protein